MRRALTKAASDLRFLNAVGSALEGLTPEHVGALRKGLDFELENRRLPTAQDIGEENFALYEQGYRIFENRQPEGAQPAVLDNKTNYSGPHGRF